MLALVRRTDVALAAETLVTLSRHAASHAPALRSALLDRPDLPLAARDVLAPIYGGFTEGFETADLRRAAALLAQF